jgi:hypothetical protein
LIRLEERSDMTLTRDDLYSLEEYAGKRADFL